MRRSVALAPRQFIACRKRLANEIHASLSQGDHLRHGHQILRALISVAGLIVAPLFPRHELKVPRGDTAVALIIANPVAHGSRFARSVKAALEPIQANIVADGRLADNELAGAIIDFPALTVKSLIGVMSLCDLRDAVSLRLRFRKGLHKPPGVNLLYYEVLVLMQSIRYSLAQRFVHGCSGDLIFLADFDRAAFSRPLMWHANRTGRTTATLIHGTPNENYLAPLASNLLVWGESQSNWFSTHAPLCRTYVVGRPDFDGIIEVDDVKRIQIVHSMESLTPQEMGSLRLVCDRARQADLTLTLRLHPLASPNDLGSDWSRAVGKAHFEDGRTSFKDSLQPGDIVVGVTSTAIVDALTIGVPALTVADDSRHLPCDLSLLRDEQKRAASMSSNGCPAWTEWTEVASVATQARGQIVAAIGVESGIKIRNAVRSLVPAPSSTNVEVP